ncbi:hypothetical protein MHK01_10265 [Staphylococcus auricularis]|uniref:hypothetical protein n=1 Tax=Staphylococcus auricularis TaxID=29379 RepID=UPI001EF324FD|nr:hypothetical protein [Staphylococcus auricularis]MBM0868939.1 hypothetical protein [Staphylococcus auricularis]MCG7342346.1 hypothetical protein [Staphylococcus auricularis]
MSKKNNVSINFDKKDFEKNLVKVINKNTDNFAKGMNCPVCNKTVKLKFKKRIATCPKCSSKITLDQIQA